MYNMHYTTYNILNSKVTQYRVDTLTVSRQLPSKFRHRVGVAVAVAHASLAYTTTQQEVTTIGSSGTGAGAGAAAGAGALLWGTHSFTVALCGLQRWRRQCHPKKRKFNFRHVQSEIHFLAHAEVEAEAEADALWHPLPLQPLFLLFLPSLVTLPTRWQATFRFRFGCH